MAGPPNCTLVELKYLLEYIAREVMRPPNCTLVELKLDSCLWITTFEFLQIVP